MRRLNEKFLKPLFKGRDKTSRETSPAPSRPASSPGPSGPAPTKATPQPSNVQPPLAPVLSKNKAFEMAVAVILQKHSDLSEDDKKAFQSASDIDVIKELNKAQHGTLLISGSLSRVQKVLECVDRLMGPLKIFIQHHPDISALVVGGLKCILMV